MQSGFPVTAPALTPARRFLLPIILSGTFVQLFSVTVMQVAVVDVVAVSSVDSEMRHSSPNTSPAAWMPSRHCFPPMENRVAFTRPCSTR